MGIWNFLKRLVGKSPAINMEATKKAVAPKTSGTSVRVPTYNYVVPNGFSAMYDETLKCGRITFYTLTADHKKLDDAAPRVDHWHDGPTLKTASYKEAAVWEAADYDRGHLVPAEDMQYDDQVCYAAYSMANIGPQVAEFNRGLWAHIELNARSLVSEGDVKIWTGTLFRNGTTKVIGTSHVPSHFWKVATTAKSSHAWVVPNDKSVVGHSADEYTVDIKTLADEVGVDFV